MNEQWRQQMRQKMADYRRPAPEVSWDEIDKALTTQKGSRNWWLRIAAAAAIVALAGTGYWLMQDKAPEQEPLTAENTTNRQQPVEAQSAPISVEIEHSEAPKMVARVETTPHATPSVIQQPMDTAVVVETAVSPTTITDTTTTDATETHLHPLPDRGIVSFPLGSDKRKVKKETRLTAKVYYGNTMMGSRMTNELYYFSGYDFPINLVRPDINPTDNNNSNESQPDNSNAFNIDSTSHVSTRIGPKNGNIRYHQPIRFGVSLRYQLNERWSIESGLTYTRLVTDIGSVEHRHDYLGLPLNMGYQLWSNRHFGVYLTAGGTIEKMLDASPWQLSVNGAVGLEYKLTNKLHLYAEPGLGYYFSNRSKIPTIYQDKPLNFNLNIGLRFDLK